MTTDNNDSVVDFNDIFESLDEEKAIIMGGIDNKSVCSFTKGYVKRQAVYSCLTCLDISKTRAGFCFPCSITCHEGHDVIELYTKRNFRCDCGNAKFNGFQCALWEEKDDENVDNRYNDNFSNEYCTCKRPYPDESYEGVEEMFQCGICEDWFHIEHLNVVDGFTVPEDHEELTCFQCAQKHAFLILYAIHSKEQPLTAIVNGSIDAYTHAGDADKCVDDDTAAKRSRIEVSSDDSTAGISTPSCRLSDLISEFNLVLKDPHRLQLVDLPWIEQSKTPSIFWSAGWRERLCRCALCKEMYREHDIQFLLDPEDTMKHYHKVGEQKAIELDKEDNDALNAALSELPHEVAVNFALGVNNLRKALEDFFRKANEENRVVTEAEVRTFFEKLREEERRF